MSSRLVSSKHFKLPARPGSDNDPSSDPSDAIHTERQGRVAGRRCMLSVFQGPGLQTVYKC